MEKDIKNLEEIINLCEKEIDNNDNNLTAILDLEDLKSLRNLINRNKKLEKELEEKDMQHELELIGKEEYTKSSMGEIIEQYYTANEDCIPKSVIQEKIEEIKSRNDDCIALHEFQREAKIDILQELLEEKEK